MEVIRPPMDTISEMDSVEVASGALLDEVAAQESISRMAGEPDENLRERVRAAIAVRRASNRVERGESLLPPLDVGPVNLAFIERDVLAKENVELKKRLAAQEAELLRLRAASGKS